MDTTVGALKVGAQLVMGKYGVDKDNPYPIVWLKGNPRGIVMLAMKTITGFCISLKTTRLLLWLGKSMWSERTECLR